MTNDDELRVSAPHVQCPLGHLRLERFHDGVYCRRCNKKWPEDEIDNQRERIKNRKKRRENL